MGRTGGAPPGRPRHGKADCPNQPVTDRASRLRALVWPAKVGRCSAHCRHSDLITADLAAHLEQVAGPGNDDLVFTSPEGEPLHHGNFRRRVWLPALHRVGLDGVRLHDLRHAGNDLSATAAANLRELMERMGHSSTKAALIYLHSSGSTAADHRGGGQRPRMPTHAIGIRGRGHV